MKIILATLSLSGVSAIREGWMDTVSGWFSSGSNAASAGGAGGLIQTAKAAAQQYGFDPDLVNSAMGFLRPQAGAVSQGDAVPKEGEEMAAEGKQFD